MGIEMIAIAFAGIATFLGLFIALGRLTGKALAKRRKRLTEKAIEKLSEPILRDAIVKSMKEADEWLSTSEGQAKMNWVIDKFTAFIPGGLDDKPIRDYFQGLYQGYKDEMAVSEG